MVRSWPELSVRKPCHKLLADARSYLVLKRCRFVASLSCTVGFDAREAPETPTPQCRGSHERHAQGLEFKARCHLPDSRLFLGLCGSQLGLPSVSLLKWKFARDRQTQAVSSLEIYVVFLQSSALVT